MSTKTKDDGSGTRSQWMRLAEEAIQDAAEWKRRANEMLATLKDAYAYLQDAEDTSARAMRRTLADAIDSAEGR